MMRMILIDQMIVLGGVLLIAVALVAIAVDSWR